LFTLFAFFSLSKSLRLLAKCALQHGTLGAAFGDRHNRPGLRASCTGLRPDMFCRP
jgi:hypothetical protein